MPKPWSPYSQIVIETYHGPARGGHGSVRARPVPGQFYPTSMAVECSKEMRTKHPVGTRFLIHAKESSREGSDPFLYTHFSWPYKVVK